MEKRVAAALHVCVIALLVGASAYIVMASLHEASIPPYLRAVAVWPVNAVILSAVIRAAEGTRAAMFAACLLADLLANLALGDSYVTAWLLALSNAFEVLVAVALFARRGTRGIQMPCHRLIVDLAFRAGIIAPACGATLAASLLALIEHAPLPTTWSIWFMADALGMFIILPLTLAVTTDDLHGLIPTRKLGEAFLILTAFITTDIVVFAQTRYPILFMLFPLLMLTAFRLCFPGVVLMLCVSSYVAVSFTHMGLGPISLVAGAIPEERILLLQFFLAAAVLTALPIAAIERRHEDLKRNLHHRVTELAKTCKPHIVHGRF